MKKILNLFLVAACMVTPALAESGSMEPPASAMTNGVPVATMKSLNQIEPRTLISQLPYNIVMPGSYYVTMPLPGVINSNGITISSGNVRLDINGFALMGVSNSLDGIRVMPGCFNVVIRNGVIASWGGFGVNASSSPEIAITDVKCMQNGSGGIYTGNNALIERCSVYGNGFLAEPVNPPADDGIQAGPYSTIIECKARFNHGANIHTFEHSRITACTASESGNANGIWAQDYCTIRDCTAARNFKDGIFVGSMCRVIENTCGQNGTNSENQANSVGGITVGGGNNFIEKNNLFGNNSGIKVVGAGNLIIHNVCSKNSPGADFSFPNPQTFKSNFVGQVTSFAMENEGFFSTNNPWANFQVP